MTEPDRQPDPDVLLARVMHQWLDSHPKPQHRRLREAVEQWLVAKGL